MNQNQVKTIQSRLKTRGQKFTLEQLRTYILTHYHDEELSEDQMSAIVEKLSGSSEIVPSSGRLSNTQKQTLIQEVASDLNIDLPVAKIKAIAQKIDWAISDRAESKERIKAAIIAWVDHQIKQDKEDTEETLQEVQQHLVNKLEESNDHFEDEAEKLFGRIERARDKFRDSEKEILSLFKVPG